VGKEREKEVENPYSVSVASCQFV